eukprot:825391-Karenia_brevis.AAC.1
MMVEEKIMLTLMNVLQQVFLLPELRRNKALPKFGYRDELGYRDVIIEGDLRQLPLASPDAQVPFWARDFCYEDFEFFVLTED